MSNLVGIFATGRSGSTLLMGLLDGSRGLWIHPLEVNAFAVRGLYERSPEAFRAWAEGQIEEVERDYVAGLEEEVVAACDPLESLSDGERPFEDELVAFLEGVRRAYDPDPVSRHLLAFKTIEVDRIDRYVAAFPELRLVHGVRDPLATYASLKRTDMVMKKKPFWFQNDILRTHVERRWLPHARYVLDHAEDERHRLVRYEDVCRDPARAVGDVCDWLGVPPPREPALQTALGGRRMRRLPPRTSGDSETPAAVVPNTADAFGYEDVVTQRERDFIVYRTGSLGARLGYSSPDRRPRRLRMLRSWLLPDRWELMNVQPRRAFLPALLSRRAYVLRKLVRGT